MYYESVKVTIDAFRLVEVIIDVIVQYHDLLDSIVIDRGSVFTLKFWFLLYYFLDIKWQLSIAFYPQIDRQIEYQNSTMEA